LIKQALFTNLCNVKAIICSTAQSFRCKQYSPVESRLLPVETVPHPKMLVSGTLNMAFPFLLTAYN